MVFVVASHTMVVEAGTNPDGTMKRKPPANLPKSDLRGKWQKEDPRLAMEPSSGPRGAYTVTTKSTSVRTHEDHTGSGRRVRFDQLGSRLNDDAIGYPQVGRGRSLTRGSSHVRSSAADALLASRMDDYNSFEPVSTVTEKFKSVTTRRPVTSTLTPPSRPMQREFEYHEPVYSSYQPAITVTPITPTTRPPIAPVSSSKALVPFQKRVAQASALPPRGRTPLCSYGDRELVGERRRIERELARRPLSREYSMEYPKRTPVSPVIPPSFRGLPLASMTHERDSRMYEIPLYSLYSPLYVGKPAPVADYYSQYKPSTLSSTPSYLPPYTPSHIPSYKPSYPAGFLTGRRHSLPARPTRLLSDYDEDDLYTAPRRSTYVPSYKPATQVMIGYTPFPLYKEYSHSSSKTRSTNTPYIWSPSLFAVECEIQPEVSS